MKDELGEKIMVKFVGLGAITCLFRTFIIRIK